MRRGCIGACRMRAGTEMEVASNVQDQVDGQDAMLGRSG
jgi:hypothetical protein